MNARLFVADLEGLRSWHDQDVAKPPVLTIVNRVREAQPSNPRRSDAPSPAGDRFMTTTPAGRPKAAFPEVRVGSLP